jgi:hypothetical protein
MVYNNTPSFSDLETIVRRINQLVRDYSAYMSQMEKSNIRPRTSEFETFKCKVHGFVVDIVEAKGKYDNVKQKLAYGNSLSSHYVELWDGTQTTYIGWEDRYNILLASMKKILGLLQSA